MPISSYRYHITVNQLSFVTIFIFITHITLLAIIIVIFVLVTAENYIKRNRNNLEITLSYKNIHKTLLLYVQQTSEPIHDTTSRPQVAKPRQQRLPMIIIGSQVSIF